MPFTTPKTNWVSTDYYNVADFARLYENARLTSTLAAVMLGTPIVFNTLTIPTTATVGNIREDLNTLLANIENIRSAMSALLPGLSSITSDWAAGLNAHSPDYMDANLWESTVDAIWDYWSGDSLEVNKTLSADLTVTTGNKYIVVDSLDANGYNITVQDGAVLAIL